MDEVHAWHEPYFHFYVPVRAHRFAGTFCNHPPVQQIKADWLTHIKISEAFLCALFFILQTAKRIFLLQSTGISL